MAAETLLLHIARGFVVEIIQAALANADHPRMLGGGDNIGHAGNITLARLLRMSAHRAPDLGKPLGDGFLHRRLMQTRADGDHAGHASTLGPGDDLGLILGGEMVEMAMAVDDHAGRSSLRNSGAGGGSAKPPGSGVASAARLRASSGTPS